MKSIYLSAGHSDTDPGATVKQEVGCCPDGHPIDLLRKESDIAVEFRNLVSFYLQVAGIEHGLDGHGTKNLPLREAAAQARDYDIAVEFHTNAFTSPKATGAETLSGQQDMVLGARLAQAVADALGIYNRGAKPENAGQHSRLAFVQAGGVIVELFFLTNPLDLAMYDAKKWVAARDVAQVLIVAAGGRV